MSLQIIATKLYVPSPRPDVVPRPRLIDHLNAGLHHGKLTLISAAAGCGKTTLVSEWIHNLRLTIDDLRLTSGAGENRQSEIVNLKFGWLSLDEGDHDLTRFLVYLIAALQTVVSTVGEGALAMLQSPQPPPTETILATLLNEVATIPGKFILVLDDYHLVDAPSIDKALTFLLDYLPPQMHLVIATREDPALPIARYRVRGQLTELRAADLRFTPAETAVFLNQTMGLNLSEADVTALENRTEGWIAGLQLAALTLQGLARKEQNFTHGPQEASRFIQSFTGSHHFVLDYLMEEVLQQQPESVQTFLLCTSILDRLCAPLCAAVYTAVARHSAHLSPAPPATAPEILKYLEQANLFLIPLDGERRWYRYHHLFGDLLRQRLHQNPPPLSSSASEGTAQERVAELHRRAGKWYEENDFPFAAIRHTLAAADFEQAAGLIELAWPTVDASFESDTWLSWVQALPEEMVLARPVLLLGYAWSHLNRGELKAGAARLRDAERWLGAAAALDEESGALPQGMVVVDEEQFRLLPASIATARSYHAQVLGDVPGTIRHGRRALDLLPEEDHARRALVGGLLGIAYWTSGNLEAAYRSLAAARDGLETAGNILFAIGMTYGLGGVAVAQGRLREAIRIYERALQLAQEHGEPVLQGTADQHLWLCEVYIEQGKMETAVQHLRKSEALGAGAALPDWPHRLCLTQARIKEAAGDLDAALDLLDQAKRLYYPVPVPDVRPIGALQARVWIKQGRLDEALEWAQERALSVADEPGYLREFEQITLARIRMAEFGNGRLDDAIHDAMKRLDRLLIAAEKGDRIGSMIEILVLQALGHKAEGNAPAALAPLARALALAEPEGFVRVFVEEGAEMAELLPKVLEELDGSAPDSSLNKTPDESKRVKTHIRKVLAALGRKEEADPHQPAQEKRPSPTRQPLVESLSPRELEVLHLVALGLSNREISQRLVLAVSTVKGHNARIFAKLQVQRRTEAVARARELGLL